MTEEQKMLAGKLYDPSDSKLEKRRQLAHRLSKEYNDTLETDAEKRKAIMAELLPDCGEGTFLQGPLQFDYGCYTKFGKRCYANFNLVVLDVCPVVFGDDVFIGPNCSSVKPAACHLLCRGGVAKLSPLIEEMPGRAEELFTLFRKEKP